jgi:hypothetical protein
MIGVEELRYFQGGAQLVISRQVDRCTRIYLAHADPLDVVRVLAGEVYISGRTPDQFTVPSFTNCISNTHLRSGGV